MRGRGALSVSCLYTIDPLNPLRLSRRGPRNHPIGMARGEALHLLGYEPIYWGTSRMSGMTQLCIRNRGIKSVNRFDHQLTQRTAITEGLPILNCRCPAKISS